MLGTPGAPPGPDVIAFGSFASSESPFFFLVADPLEHLPTVSVVNMVHTV